MKCPICGTQLDENAKECFVCGYKLENTFSKSSRIDGENTVICPMCGMAVDQSNSVCPVCGTKLKPDIKKNVDDSILDNSSPQEIKKPSSKPESNKLSDISGKNKPDNIQTPEQKNAEQTTNKPKQRRTGLIIAIVCIIIAACIIVVLFLTGIIGPGGAELTSEEESAVTDVNEQVSDGISSEQTEEMNVAPNSSYIGYWNISGNEDEELAISNVTEDTVEFSLYSRGKYTLENANAYIDENNFASFACVDDKLMMTGDLIFYDDYIIVDIDRADMDYLDNGTMVFDERHLSSWRENDDESVNSQGITSQNSETSYEVEPYYESGNISSNYDSYYILPDSSTELLDYNDIRYLTKEELRLARNEIYARHGRKFDDPTLQAYFNSQPWYTGTIEPEDFTQDMLSSIERTNVAFIESYE